MRRCGLTHTRVPRRSGAAPSAQRSAAQRVVPPLQGRPRQTYLFLLLLLILLGRHGCRRRGLVWRGRERRRGEQQGPRGGAGCRSAAKGKAQTKVSSRFGMEGLRPLPTSACGGAAADGHRSSSNDVAAQVCATAGRSVATAARARPPASRDGGAGPRGEERATPRALPRVLQQGSCSASGENRAYLLCGAAAPQRSAPARSAAVEDLTCSTLNTSTLRQA